jgi:hypothetical protein
VRSFSSRVNHLPWTGSRGCGAANPTLTKGTRRARSAFVQLNRDSTGLISE